VPSDENSHPHISNDGTIAIVHNGIIENYLELKKELLDLGYRFDSDTDTEVVVHLLEHYKEPDFISTITKTINRLVGSYSIGILSLDNPDILYCVKNESPLVIGLSENESFIASDIPAILEYTKNVIYLDNKEIGKLSSSGVKVYYEKKLIEKEVKHIEWDIDAASKCGYDHFMLKEIYEQPDIIRNTIRYYLKNDIPNFDIPFNNINKIYIVACGTAYHAGLVSKPLIEEFTNVSVEVDIASEFRYRNPIINEKTLVIIISQSGETADTLAALRLANEKGATTISLVNVVGSSIARESEYVIYTKAGPEIAVASTKAFTSQLVTLYMLSLYFGLKTNILDENLCKEYVLELMTIPRKINEVLENKNIIEGIAKKFYKEKDVYFIGRGTDDVISKEGALKLKEISYIHADAYPAGELKHGPIALIEKGTLVVATCTIDNLIPKIVSNIKEVISRGAVIFTVSTEKLNISDYEVIIPKINYRFTSILAIVPLQLFAYYIAINKGIDVDKPRNLAKSVTVE
jgi:glucosamine--fructose-6-phosphate aminotransferase (isomerizing)